MKMDILPQINSCFIEVPWCKNYEIVSYPALYTLKLVQYEADISLLISQHANPNLPTSL